MASEKMVIWLGSFAQLKSAEASGVGVDRVLARLDTDTLSSDLNPPHPLSNLKALLHVNSCSKWVVKGYMAGFDFGVSRNEVIAPRDGSSYKRVSILSRRSGISRDEFMFAWNGVHADLVKQMPDCCGYVQSSCLSFDLPFEVDGVAQLWYPNKSAMLRAYRSPAREALRTDARSFIGKIITFEVEEQILDGTKII